MPSNLRQPAMFVSTGDPETVDDVLPYAAGQLGGKVTVAAPAGGANRGPGKTYQYVKGDPAMVAAPFANCVMYWLDQDKYIVTTAVANLSRPAGIYKRATAPGANGNYWYLQIAGRSLVRYIDAPTSAPAATGKFVVGSATVGKADCIVTAPTSTVIGISAGTQDGTSKEGLVDLQLPETA